MMDEPAMPMRSTDMMDDDCKKSCDVLCQDKSINEIRQLANYFNNKADELSQIAENDLTIEDFEDAKKEDLDNDQGEGEEHGY